MLKWIKEGNNCEKCKALWESHTSNECGEEWDCGCYVKGSDYDESVCRLPRFLRWLLIRKANYHINHQYDGIIEWYKKQEEEDCKCREAIKVMLDARVICRKDIDGGLHECDTDAIIQQEAWRVRHACEPESKKPPNLTRQWVILIKKTLLWMPNKIKPFVCK